MLSRVGASASFNLRKSMIMASTRMFSAESDDKITLMKSRISTELNPTTIDIQDVSGGCGAFFKVLVVSDKFDGKATLARHRLVQSILKNDIADMHGLTLTTFTPKQYEESQQQ